MGPTALKGTTVDENLILVTFEDDSHAYEGLARLKQLESSAQLALREAGVVQRSDTGVLSLGDDFDNDAQAGTISGGFIGLLVGILGGPIGVLFGGAVGLLAGGLYDVDQEEETDSVLERIARNIPNGATALVGAVGEEGPAALDGTMHAIGGSVSRYVREDVEAEIAAVDTAARKARRRARKDLRRSRRDAVREKVQAKLDEMREKLRAGRQKLVHH
jgi:uncharacterized membrane protein